MNRRFWTTKRSGIISSASLQLRSGSLTLRVFNLLVFLWLATLPVWGQKLSYPPARYDSSVVDNYHGTKVADPYRWLEEPDASETAAWVEAQNKLTRQFVDAVPARERIKARVTKLLDYPKYSLPYREGDRYFFSKNDGLQNQSVLYMQKTLDGKPTVVIDPNNLSTDGTVSLSSKFHTKNGKLMAYGLSERGSDQQVIKIRDVETGKDFDETLQWCKFTSVAWNPDNSGFYNDRFPQPGTVPKEDESNFNRVYWHKLGTPQSGDVLLYERPDAKELGFNPIVTDDGKYLLLYIWHSTDPKNRIYYRELASEGSFVKLLDKADAMYAPVHNVGSLFYFHTDFNAPRGKVITIDLKNPAAENWKEVLPESERVISSVSVVNDQMVVVYRQDAHNKMKIFNLDGAFVKDIELPTIGSVAGISGKPEDSEMFFNFTSFLYPTTSFRYDFKSGKLLLFRKSEVDFDPSGFETKQVFYKSKDGTKVPMFITHKKGLKLNGGNPTLLYGYGGFNNSVTPTFSVSRVIWMEAGGVYAVANLRGGDEYGEEWHQAGMLEKKQNVFDDFIAAGEWLVQNKYTSTSKLAIQGGSNGGLLVAACML